MFSRHKQTINNYIKQGYTKKFTEVERKKVFSRTLYLPDHPVFNTKETEKIRVVFEATAINNGQSLNSSLFAGPGLLNSLIAVLFRFGNNNIAIVADVDVMFLLIGTIH